jgi:hypothetical protein
MVVTFFKCNPINEITPGRPKNTESAPYKKLFHSPNE